MNAAHSLGPFIIPCTDEPPRHHEYSQPTPNQTRVVHCRGGRGQEIRETVNDKPNDHVRARDGVHGEAQRALHVKGAVDDILASGEEVGEDSGDVGGGAHEDKGADEGVEGGGAADVDGEEDGDEGGADEGCDEGHAEAGVDCTDLPGEGGRGVAGEGPQDAAGGDVDAEDGEDDGDEKEEEETDLAGRGAGRLVVDLCDGEGRGEEGFVVADCVH